MITTKMAAIFDHQATTGIQEQVDHVIQERMQQYDTERQQRVLMDLDRITALTDKNLQLITAANTAATQFLENKQDACIKSIEITKHTMDDTIKTLRNVAIERIKEELHAAILILEEKNRVIKQDMDDIVNEARTSLDTTRTK
jgi:hypothetical protein